MSAPKGPWRIEADHENETECEGPHPVRLGRNAKHIRYECRERRNAIDEDKKGYLCPGGETHFYTVWVLVNGDEQGDWFDMYKLAVAARDRLNAEVSHMRDATNPCGSDTLNPINP
jgi:hypothetical protein